MRPRAARCSPVVMDELINLALHAEDERVRRVCCVAVLYGRPREMKEDDGIETRIANMTREERLAHMASLLGPMRAYLHELDNEEEETGAKLMPVKRRAVEIG